MEQLEFGTKKLGFGFMRLPTLEGGAATGGTVDTDQVCKMVDAFLAAGFCYFDTAHGYVDNKCESLLRQCLVERHPRSSYILTDKLTTDFFKEEADILPLFEKQLEETGVTYFDYYLMHAMTAKQYKKYSACNAFALARQLKAEGKIRHIGISFHDKPDVLEQILTEHPEVEVVQIQFNYVDYDDSGIQSRAVYETCRKFKKPVIVMEPVKGGCLANLPEEARQIFDSLHGGSYASYAIRFAASFEGIAMVLSGMSSLEQMQDNLQFMQNFQPLTPAEREAVSQVCEVMKKQDAVPCTACRYCVPGCPKHILIPDLFACLNAKKRFDNWNSSFYYQVSTANGRGKASDCIGCGQCEEACPQHLPVTSLLKDVAEAFEKKKEDPAAGEKKTS